MAGAFIEETLFADEVDVKSVKTNNLSSDNFSTTNATIDNLTITGSITAGTFNFSTANLIAGDNITIVDDVISAFLGSDSIVNINSLHSDGNVDVVGVLNVCQTSTFGSSLNVPNIIYAGVAGQHEGGLVLYSNIVCNNFAQTYNSSGDEVNITATGTTTAINYFVGETNVLRIAPGTFEVEAVNANEIEANVFTCIDGRSTFRFSTPTLNVSTINLSGNMLTDGNISCLNFSADVAFIEDLNVSDTFEAGNLIGETLLITGDSDVDNVSARNITCSNNLEAVNKIIAKIKYLRHRVM